MGTGHASVLYEPVASEISTLISPSLGSFVQPLRNTPFLQC